jgi:hypothetical protein
MWGGIHGRIPMGYTVMCGCNHLGIERRRRMLRVNVSEKYGVNVVFVENKDIENIGDDNSIELLRMINPRNLIVANFDTYSEVGEFITFVAKCHTIRKFKISDNDKLYEDICIDNSKITVIVHYTGSKTHTTGVSVCVLLGNKAMKV